MKSITFNEVCYSLFNRGGVKFNKKLIPLLEIGDHKKTIVNDLEYTCFPYNAEKTIFYFQVKVPSGNTRSNTSQLVNVNGEFVERPINPHKGGRDCIISSMRVTEKEKKIIDEARKDLSYSDYLVQKALKDVRRKNP